MDCVLSSSYVYEFPTSNRQDVLKEILVRPKSPAAQLVGTKSAGSWYLSGVGEVDGYGCLTDPIPSPGEDVRQEMNAETVDNQGYPSLALQSNKVAAYQSQ